MQVWDKMVFSICLITNIVSTVRAGQVNGSIKSSCYLFLFEQSCCFF